jgi:Tfp pilus assembly protein PilO
MNNWQLYLAIFILILLVSIKVKEGNTLPDYATHYDKPSDLIQEVQSIIKGEPNYDKNQYQNTRYENRKLENIRNDVNNIYIRESEILAQCKRDLDTVFNKISVTEKDTALVREEIATQEAILKQWDEKLRQLNEVIGQKENERRDREGIFNSKIRENNECRAKL